MKIELSKKELEVIMVCINITERSIRGESLLSFMSPAEVVRRLRKIDLNAFWYKLRNLNN